jgi:hypothetical protein
MVNQLQPLAVANLVEQIKPHVGSLPEPQRTEIAAPLKLLEDEIKSGSPEPSKLQGALRSILTISGDSGHDHEDAVLASVARMERIATSAARVAARKAGIQLGF